jgi:hypothetical protein
MNTILAQIQARAARASDFMATVNRMPPAAALASMKAHAGHEHAEFPQYRGKWDNHKIGQMTRSVKTKMGVAFEKGDFCMYVEDTLEGKAVVSVYSIRNGAETIVNPSYVKAV